jgi:putative protein kinase ArgK-like GTPase of G3E family
VKDIGIGEIVKHIEKHRFIMGSTGLLKQDRQEQRRREFLETIEDKVTASCSRLSNAIRI